MPFLAHYGKLHHENKQATMQFCHQYLALELFVSKVAGGAMPSAMYFAELKSGR
jgi:hypothetical protein